MAPVEGEGGREGERERERVCVCVTRNERGIALFIIVHAPCSTSMLEAGSKAGEKGLGQGRRLEIKKSCCGGK